MLGIIIYHRRGFGGTSRRRSGWGEIVGLVTVATNPVGRLSCAGKGRRFVHFATGGVDKMKPIYKIITAGAEHRASRRSHQKSGRDEIG